MVITTYNILRALTKNKYANRVLPTIKKAILAGGIPEDCYLLARAMDTPWPEAEPIIAESPTSSANYARYILKGRFPLGEKALAETPSYALYADYRAMYALRVLIGLCGMIPDEAKKIMDVAK